MKKAVIYARYSCDSQSEQSIEGQLRVCKDYAKANDILIVDTYIDRAMSGTNDMRPDFQRMLMDSAKHQWEIVLVYKLDRFSRNKYEATIHKHTLKENGVKLISAMENIPDTPEGIILESLLEGMNQYYSAELRQKVNRGLKESWRKGKATGGRPVFGYDVVDQRYIINEYEADIIRKAFSLYAQGNNARLIAELFKELGYRKKDGSSISEAYLYKLLHNRIYTGVATRQGVVYDNIFPRIIPDDLWETVSAITDENKQSPSRKKEKSGFILSGRLICGDCKHRMIGVSGTSRTGATHYYYACRSWKLRHKKCEIKPIPKQYLEDLVIHHTIELLNNPEEIHRIAVGVYELNIELENDYTALNLLEKSLETKRKAIGNIIKAIEMGIITDATKNRLQELDAEITGLEFEIDKEKARTHINMSVEQIETFLTERVFTKDCDLETRKLLVKTFIRQVFLYQDKVVIVYNHTKNPDKIENTTELAEKVEGEIETAKKVDYSGINGSSIQPVVPPFAL